jgi:hypothetical protein
MMRWESNNDDSPSILHYTLSFFYRFTEFLYRKIFGQSRSKSRRQTSAISILHRLINPREEMFLWVGSTNFHSLTLSNTGVEVRIWYQFCGPHLVRWVCLVLATNIADAGW